MAGGWDEITHCDGTNCKPRKLPNNAHCAESRQRSLTVAAWRHVSKVGCTSKIPRGGAVLGGLFYKMLSKLITVLIDIYSYAILMQQFNKLSFMFETIGSNGFKIIP